MKNNESHQGFSLAIIITTVIAIMIVGLLGYTVYNQFIGNSDSGPSEQSPVADDVDIDIVPETISGTDDLEMAQEALDKIDDTATSEDIVLIDGYLAEF